MHSSIAHSNLFAPRRAARWTASRWIASRWILPVLALMTPLAAQALPAFARQTGQNCVSCHAGGQFPELTPYGRLFKLTGYTIGQRTTIPLSVMGVGSYTKTRDTTSDAPSVDFPKDGAPIFQTGSVFLAGKITNNLGLFAQVTYDNYASQNPDTLAWSGHSQADNIDVRYADRFIDRNRDLIVGLSLNNNPSVADVWNTAPAWLQYVPTGFGFTGPSAAPMIASLGQQVAGIGAYAFWNQTVYAEFSAYQAATGAFSFMKQGGGIDNRLRGANPYVRLALSHEWGPHNAMVGIFGMNADVYAPDTSSGPTTRFRDRGVDAQYQYILDPHTVTAQISYIRENIDGGDVTGIAANGSNTLNQFKLKGSYIYRAKYGASLSYFSTTGSSDEVAYPSGLVDDGTGTGTLIATPISGNVANSPDTRGWIPEVFWTPAQYVRVGLQYFKYDRFNGATTNYDGAGRNAKDNNTLFLYVWAAY